MASLTVYQQIERVRNKALPEWRQKDSRTLLDFIKKGEVERVGERSFLIPAEVEEGGRDGTYDPQGGDMGRGSQPQGVVMTQNYFALRLNFEFDKLSLKATANKATAVGGSPLVRTLARGFATFQKIRNKYYQGDGTAVLATATAHSSVSGVSVYTTAINFGTQRLRRGQYVTVYNNALTTIKSAGVARITGINTQAGTFSLNIVVPGAANDDQFCFEGVSGTNPAGPRGLAYWISSALSGTTAGINRANEPQIISKSVDAAGAPFHVEHVQGLYDRILLDRGEVADELIGICSPTQRAAAYNQVMSIQQIHLEGVKAEMVDRLPALKGRKSFMYGDLAHYPDIHHDKTVNHYMIPKMWGRAVLQEEDFFETDGKSGSDARFIQIYGGSGGPAAATWLGLTCEEQPYSIDPGAQGLISNLPIPALH